jgi:hypothetical protein
VVAWSATRTIRPEADAVTVEIPRLDDPRVAGAAKPVAKPAAPAAAPAAKPATLPPAPAPAAAPGPAQLVERHAREARPEPSGPSTARRVLPFALGGAALALGGGAIGFKISGDHRYDEAVAVNMRDNGAAAALHDAANTRLYAAQALGAAAIACTGAAIYFYLSGRAESPPPITAIVPTASAQHAGLAILGRW